ncbi:hypothetical protein HMI54_012200 [Coelomomyces lativittatus]|nr:hypothetical protein HMI54_012200 [Coelomomyces lativittatus]
MYMFVFSLFFSVLDSWGIKGERGELYYNSMPVATAKYTFKNGDKVGILLDMDNGTADFYVNKEHVLSFKSKALKNTVIYPAASTILDGEELTIDFNVSPPEK